jgi:hypothetical protein
LAQASGPDASDAFSPRICCAAASERAFFHTARAFEAETISYDKKIARAVFGGY